MTLVPPSEVNGLLADPGSDWRSLRCGHNFPVGECPYSKCRLKEVLAEVIRLRAREQQLLEACNAELDRRRTAERERDNMRTLWERAFSGEIPVPGEVPKQPNGDGG